MDWRKPFRSAAGYCWKTKLDPREPATVVYMASEAAAGSHTIFICPVSLACGVPWSVRSAQRPPPSTDNPRPPPDLRGDDRLPNACRVASAGTPPLGFPNRRGAAGSSGTPVSALGGTFEPTFVPEPWHSRQRKRGPPYRMRHWRWHPGHLNHCRCPPSDSSVDRNSMLSSTASVEPSDVVVDGQRRFRAAAVMVADPILSPPRDQEITPRMSGLQKATTAKDGDVQRQVTFSRPALISLPSPRSRATHIASPFFSKSFGKLGHGH